MAISVAVAVGKTGDKLVEKLKSRVQSLKIREGMDPEAEMGPGRHGGAQGENRELSSKMARSAGAKLVVDGRGSRRQGRRRAFLAGTLFDHVTRTCASTKRRSLARCLCVVRVPNLDSAIELINKHEFGNGVSCYTRNGGTAR